MGPQSVTETVVIYVKEGVNLVDANNSPEKEAFRQSINILKTQQGFLGQSFGHQVENPIVFIWYIHWQAFESHTIFSQSEDYKPFMSAIGQAFDIDAGAPLLMHTHFRDSSDLASALKAPVTEVAFLSLPNGTSEEIKSTVEQKMVPVLRDVKAVGKAWGSAIGWLVDPEPHAADADGDSIALHGIFGYDSIEAHMKWREASEHAQAIGIMAGLKESYGLRAVNGRGLKMFHVKFQTEV